MLLASAVVRAQHSQSPAIVPKQKALPVKKRPPAKFPAESDDNQDTKLAIYQVHRLADKILALRSVRAKAFELALGLYLFTAPDLVDSDYYNVTLVDQIIVPNITADRRGVPQALVRTYLSTAADVLWRMTPDAEQRKYSYALCYMLLPKSRNVAPDLTTKLDAVIAALTPEVSAGLTSDSAFRYMNALPKTNEEKLTDAENRPDQEGRDIAYLEIALQAWRKGDFKTARVAQGRISDLEASQRLATIIDFGDGALAITQNADLLKAESIANRLPQGIERAILFQAIAQIRSKGPDQYLAEETVDKALKAARSTSDGRRPFLLLTASPHVIFAQKDSTEHAKQRRAEVGSLLHPQR